jgi:hypothetical protein
MSGNQKRALRTTFEQVSELYDSSRPEYPALIFDDLVALAELAATAKILEIGCGTGQATLGAQLLQHADAVELRPDVR